MDLAGTLRAYGDAARARELYTQVLDVVTRTMPQDHPMVESARQGMAVALVDLVRFSVYILMAAVLVQAVLSWFHTYTPFASVLDALTRIFLRPLRRLIPPLGGFDLSPLVLLVLLQVVIIVLVYLRPAAAKLG